MKNNNREMLRALAGIYTLYLRWEHAHAYEGIFDKKDSEVIHAMGKMAKEAIMEGGRMNGK